MPIIYASTVSRLYRRILSIRWTSWIQTFCIYNSWALLQQCFNELCQLSRREYSTVRRGSTNYPTTNTQTNPASPGSSWQLCKFLSYKHTMHIFIYWPWMICLSTVSWFRWRVLQVGRKSRRQALCIFISWEMLRQWRYELWWLHFTKYSTLSTDNILPRFFSQGMQKWWKSWG